MNTEANNMGHGYLYVTAHTADGALPVSGALVEIYDDSGAQLYRLTANENGCADAVELDAPDRGLLSDMGAAGKRYGRYDVCISHPNYITAVIHHVEVYEAVASTLSMSLMPTTDPYPNTHYQHETELPPPAVEGERGNTDILPEMLCEHRPTAHPVSVPAYITLHLGTPGDKGARNIRVRFADYIANVCASEVYPTWHTAALEANIYAQISMVLSRVNTEWYAAQGKHFDITNDVTYDQAYQEGRAIPEHVAQLAYTLTGSYCRLKGHKEPCCNTHDGMKQWDSKTLAEQGLTALQILRAQYGNDIEIIRLGGTKDRTLRQGCTGADVRILQEQLNRVRENYPGIPLIVHVDGTFGEDTMAAVQQFQQTFGLPSSGIADKGTQHKVTQIYAAITRWEELSCLSIDAHEPPDSTLRKGSRSQEVMQLQGSINFTALYYSSVSVVTQDGIFGKQTTNAVREFQRLFGLTSDGVVGGATWKMLYTVCGNIQKIVPFCKEK